MTRILFAANSKAWADYEAPLRKALDDAGQDFELVTESDPSSVDYIVYAPNSRVQNFKPYSSLKAVLNLWAGVENVTGNDTLSVPLARMVDDGMTEGMVEWCIAHVMRHHLDTDIDIKRTDHDWQPRVPKLARNRCVSVLGIGALGGAVAKALAALNFQVTGWSRRPRDIPEIVCLSGSDGLIEALRNAEILILLLPLTPETENLLNAERLSLLPKGAVVINPGRGPLIDDAALIAALDAGHLGHATLDVFRIEPLPADHPFWSHPKVTVTPHIASATRVESASRVIAENIRRGERGEQFLHLVDRSRGY